MKTRDNPFFLLALQFSLGLILTTPLAGQTLRVLHSFTPTSGPYATNNDGANPSGTLTLADNILYGTAIYGGTSGRGTVFAINTNSGAFTTAYNFTGGSDGANPSAGALLSNNTLYGTASYGGVAGAGTVFSVGTDGTGFSSLHSFSIPLNDSFGFYTNSDGAYPQASLLLSGNALYGVANNGGIAGRGTLFALGFNGSDFTTVHSFSSGTAGAYSSAGLVLVGNMLYGADYGNLGNGTVFAVFPDGTLFTNHYAFTVGHINSSGILTNSDGANPHAKLLLSGNSLYGTAEHGGSSGNGTIFAINTDGSGFRTLHNFATGKYYLSAYTNADGAHPSAELILSGTTLSGTTSSGGTSGNGTVFALNLDGTAFTNLYTFTATPTYPLAPTNCDGANPSGSLVFSGNTLYGVTASGGSAGNGTIFSLTLGSISVPNPSLTITASGTNVILTWPASALGFTLQSAPAFTGPFSCLPGASSPYTNPITATQQFYRLSQ